MYGSHFKKLRKEQGLTLEQCAQNIVSISTLFRWEKDKTDIPLSAFLKLLKKVDMTEVEFFSYVEAKNGRKDSFYVKIGQAYEEKNPTLLYSYYLHYISAYHQNHQNSNLFKAMATASLYLEITNKNIVNNTDLEKLEDFFSSEKEWNLRNIRILGSTILLLNPNFLYYQANSLISDLPHLLSINFELYLDSWTTLGNIFFILIKDSPNYALKLKEKIQNYPLDNNLTLETIRRNFLIKLLEFRISNNSKPCLDYIKLTQLIGLPKLANTFTDEFTAIKEVI